MNELVNGMNELVNILSRGRWSIHRVFSHPAQARWGLIPFTETTHIDFRHTPKMQEISAYLPNSRINMFRAKKSRNDTHAYGWKRKGKKM